jgi:hypothetical protein
MTTAIINEPARLSRAEIATFATSSQAVANYEAIQNAAFNTNPQLAAEAGAAAAAANSAAAAANSAALSASADAATKQPGSPTLTAISALDATPGLVEQVGAGAFTKRAMGVGASTSIPKLADADGRYVVKTLAFSWGAPVGATSKGAFDTATATTQDVAQRLAALIFELSAKGCLT